MNMHQSILASLVLFSLFADVRGLTSEEPSVAPSVSFSPTSSTSPTTSPSNSPSLIPTSIPPKVSTPPSDFPSLVPSTETASASSLPSDYPSMVPSIYPTFSPSVMPSEDPSQQPSSRPTRVPSVEPSPSPSKMPSISPSLPPSATPTLAPSLLPSIQPTFEPSASPSTAPSATPTASPSAAPTAKPSASPTAAPSASPTASPTHFPTFGPTRVPTSVPTFVPTEQPSASPSASPSSAPTETCYDVRSYRSPINNFTCADHVGRTDCTQWRHLGLSVDEVEILIENCPVSCGVQCGTSLRFETVYSFKLWNIDTFLSPAAVSSMNDVAVQFLTDYVSGLETESQFFVYDTVLLSQQFAGNNPSRSLRSLQSQVETNSNTLQVDVEFRGYAIGLDQMTIDSRLRDGIFSSEFTFALQRSGDATFTRTQVGKVGSRQPSTASREDSDKGVSPGGISAAIIGSVAIFAAAGFYFFKSKRTNGKNRDFVRENQTVFNNFPTSPNQSVISPASSFSFDAASNLLGRMARIVTSFSPRSSNYDEETATKSPELTNSESSESSKILVEQVSVSVEEDMIEEGDEESDEEDDDDGVHPYTGIIPPMIVIDRIDSDSDIYIEDGRTNKKKVKTVVPSMRLEASSDLIAAINDRSKPFDPATFSSFIQSNAPLGEDEDENKIVLENLQIQGAGSSFNMFSSGDDDQEDNVSKTSIYESSDALFDRLRKGEPGDGSEGTTLTTTRLDLRSRQPFGFPIMARPPRVPSEGSRNSPRSANTSPVISRDKSSTDGYNSDDTAAKERLSKKDAPSFLHSLWSKSPHNRSYPPAPKSDTSGESYNKRWGAHRRSSSKGSYGTMGSLEDEGALLTFHAPKGQLGLVLECSTETAPIITKVKDYSPLLDQVLPGDKIVMIDSTSTDKMGMQEVTSLLEGKSYRATSMRLKVFRPHDALDGTLANQVRSPTVSHLSFDGTGSLGTMSDQESPIHFGHRMMATSTSALPVPPPTAVLKRSHSEAEINRNIE